MHSRHPVTQSCYANNAADWDDPGHLVESAFRGTRCAAEEVDTILLGWLAILPTAVAPPVAARSLLNRLGESVAPPRSNGQRRIIELLRLVARARPAEERVPAGPRIHPN